MRGFIVLAVMILLPVVAGLANHACCACPDAKPAEATIAGETFWLDLRPPFSFFSRECDLDKVLQTYPNLTPTLGKGHDLEVLASAGWVMFSTRNKFRQVCVRAPRAQ